MGSHGQMRTPGSRCATGCTPPTAAPPHPPAAPAHLAQTSVVCWSGHHEFGVRVILAIDRVVQSVLSSGGW